MALAAPPAQQPRAATGTHVVQLTSQKSEAEAQASFKAIQSRYPSVLGAWQPMIRRIDLGSRGTYYRAQIGPFASAEQANEMCSSLKAAGGQCIVQRN
jgi:cell division septation protein DedD